MRTWGSLPDALLVQPPTQTGKFCTFVNEARSPLTVDAVGVVAGLIRETELGHVSGLSRVRTELFQLLIVRTSQLRSWKNDNRAMLFSSLTQILPSWCGVEMYTVPNREADHQA